MQRTTADRAKTDATRVIHRRHEGQRPRRRWLLPGALSLVTLLLMLAQLLATRPLLAVADNEHVERRPAMDGEISKEPSATLTLETSHVGDTPNSNEEKNTGMINEPATEIHKEETKPEENASLVDVVQEQKEASPALEESTSPPPQQEQPPHQQQHQSLEEEHPHPKRNYASKECGAKVLYSNEEAENKAAILNDPERDDYMRNPCERAQNKFLIIELCETIQPTSLEIANFELFSSNPKGFRLWGSERYPTQDWALIGEFEARDSRDIQSFQAQGQPSYAKFVKLELLTHHGKEHFCTLSTFRLYGISMVDEYEAEVASTSNSQQQQQQQKQELESEDLFTNLQRHKSTTTGTKEEDPLYEDYENNTGVSATAECNVVEQTKEDILLKKKPTIRTQDGAGEAMDEQRTASKSDDGEQCISETKPAESKTPGIEIDSKNVEEKKEKGEAGNNVLKTIVELGSNLKQAIGQAFSNGADVKNGTTKEGENNKQSSQEIGSRKTRLMSRRNSLFHQNPAATCRLCPRKPNLRQCSFFCRTFFSESNQMLAKRRAEKARLEFLDKVVRRQTKLFCPLPSTPRTCRRKIENSPPPQNGRAGQPQQQHLVKQGTPLSLDGQQQQTQNGQTSGGNGNGIETNGNLNGNGKPQAQKPMVTQAPLADNKGNNLRPLPGSTTNHKESVFMKLNKRLTVLEQNLSLSSEQLTELSRRYGTQADEMAKQQEKMAKMAERLAKQESRRVEEEMTQRISELQREIRRLSQQLQSVTTAVQAGGVGNGFFYRPFLAPILGFEASDAHPEQQQCTDRACITNSGQLGSVAPLHSTSSEMFGSTPVVHDLQQQGEKAAREGLWTTQQVLCLMVLVQIGTLVALKLFRSLCDRLICSSPAKTVTTSQNSTAGNLNRQQQQILMNFNPTN